MDPTTDGLLTDSMGTGLLYNAGGRNLIQYTTKKASFPKCGVTGVRLHGVSISALLMQSAAAALPIY